MKIIELAFNLALILVGGVFCISSVTLGLGKANEPGPGLIPLGTGIALVLFSLGATAESYLEKEPEGEIFSQNKRWRLVLGVLASVFAYTFALPILGFLLATFLLLAWLFKASGVKNWRGAFLASLVTTGSAYLIFAYLLQGNFPKGIVGF